ncbi:MAG: class I SAM-dependent methyltransferase [Chloroflexota bacterium]|nr:MAG: class I SAM-dependent methyltransferase [Chloroflexota bacterium]
MDTFDCIWDRKLTGVQTDVLSDPGSRWSAAARLVPTGNRLLDIGVGDGGFAWNMLARVKEACGVDVSARAVDTANRRGVHAVQCDAGKEPIPFPDGHFDVVTCLDVIAYIAEPAALLAEIARVLCPGGVAILSSVNIRYVKFIVSLVFKGRFPRTSVDREAFDGGQIHYFTTGDIVALCHGAGLKTTHTQGIIPSDRLRLARACASWMPVREFLSTGFIVRAQKEGDQRAGSVGES